MACASKLPMLLSTPSPLLCPRPSLIHLARLTHLPRTSLFIAVSGGQHRAPSSFSCFQSRQGFLLRDAAEQVHTATSTPEDCSVAARPYPEWVKMVEHVTAGGYAGRQGVDEEDAFSASEGLSEEFTRAAGACLLFAREKPHLLRLLPRRDVEVLVENGSPSLFENKLCSVRRMKAFISSDGSNEVSPGKTCTRQLPNEDILDKLLLEELGSEQACTVDVVRYLISYLCNSLGKNGGDDTKCRELVETSVRSLLSELVKADSAVQEPNSTSSAAGHNSLRHDKSQRPPDQKTGVKRGDWICPKCSFINFSRNTECLECKEARPRKQLTGQEWECPQCDFFNHGKNMACLRCDCKCPEKILASERKLGNDHSVQRSRSEGLVDAGNSMGGLESWKSTESAISQKLDRILGRSSSTSETKDTGNQSVLGQAGVRTGRRFASPEMTDPGYVPFVPLPADMFRKKPTEEQPSVKEDSTSVKADELMDTLTQGSGSVKLDKSSFSEEFNKLTVGKTSRESSDPSETLSRNPTQLSDDTNVSGSMSDDDFPEIMPMRKGENRFVVSKKKDRSLTSPQYKRRMALEQANNSSFVPFVPFPPDYFAKDKQSKDGSSTNKSAAESSSAVAGNAISIPQNDEEDKAGGTIWGGSANIGQTESTKANRNKVDSDILMSNRAGTFCSEPSQEITAKVSGLDREVENTQDAAQNGGRVFPGKSLEGSAVTEPDPLDMSEEAKAQRWFRRVAQINDISELSKIPDEDFPEIMPMRKGINRFVVSKRKTPLERRLTSQQYRRNLPIVSSEPETDSS